MTRLAYAVVDGSEDVSKLAAALSEAEAAMGVSIWEKEGLTAPDAEDFADAWALARLEARWPERVLPGAPATKSAKTGKSAKAAKAAGDGPEGALIAEFLEATRLVLFGEHLCNEHSFLIPGSPGKPTFYSPSWRDWGTHVHDWLVARGERAPSPHGYLDFYTKRATKPYDVEDYPQFRDAWLDAIRHKTAEAARAGG